MGWDLTDTVIGSFQRKTHRWSEIPYRQAHKQPGGPIFPPQGCAIAGAAAKTGRNGDGKIDLGFNEPRAQLGIPRTNYLRGNSDIF